MSGQPRDVFEAKMMTSGCTQVPKMLRYENFNLIDTPGLNDPNMTTNEWSTKYNDWTMKNGDVRIDLALLVFRQSVRPSIQDANSLAVLKEAISSCSPANLVVVFTFCDEINPNKTRGEVINKDYLDGWYNDALLKSKTV